MNTIYFNKEDNQEYAYIGIIPEFVKDESVDFLRSIPDFKSGTTSFGDIPRLQKWYQSDGKYFSKSWKDQDLERWKSNEYERDLIKLQNSVQEHIDTLDIYKYKGINRPEINSCLINKYRDGNDSIRPHRDNQTTFGDNPSVIGISVGDEREIVFKRIHYNPYRMNSIKPDRTNQQEIRLKLKSGSLFVMAGAIQKYFSHEIPKTESNDIRYSMTFRQFYE